MWINQLRLGQRGRAPPNLDVRFRMRNRISMMAAAISLSAASAQAIDVGCSKPQMLEVDEHGGCHLDAAVVDCSSVGSLLRSMRMRADCELRISGSPYAPYKQLGALIQSLQDAGFTKVAFASKEAN